MEYIEQGSVFNVTERFEYTFYFNNRRWECKRPHCGMMSGTMSDITAEMFSRMFFGSQVLKERQLIQIQKVLTPNHMHFMFSEKRCSGILPQ